MSCQMTSHAPSRLCPRLEPRQFLCQLASPWSVNCHGLLDSGLVQPSQGKASPECFHSQRVQFKVKARVEISRSSTGLQLDLPDIYSELRLLLLSSSPHALSLHYHPTHIMSTIRHEFYETDERLILSVFDRNADPEKVSVKFEPRSVTYEHGENRLELTPLKGQIIPDQSSYSVGKVKVEIKLVKAAQGRWSALVGDAPDPLASPVTYAPKVSTLPQARKNWDNVTKTILESEKPKTSQEDPNVNGDNTLNEFFQGLYSNADEDTRRAMVKSFQESGGTALSTNWSEVGKGPVPVKPPAGSEARKWEQ
ncbi:SGS domain-containing protein [Amylostereum chailletii]|nr:SGS domain-containing protein [Amylostereum chailletii]